jgi:hypothetical protein
MNDSNKQALEITHLEEYDFTVPKTIDSVSVCTDILNRAPHNIAYLKELISERDEKLNGRYAFIQLENPNAKNSIVSAKQQLDEESKLIRKEIRKIKVLLDLWERVFISARKQYH